MTYSMTSSRFEGEILFTYNDDLFLVKMEIKATLNMDQHIYILQNMPGNFTALEDMARRLQKTMKVCEVVENVTFAMFWDRYDDKIRSSKKKAEIKWNKLSTGHQVLAYEYIPTYERNRGTAEKKYAETYLNAELWNN